MDGYEVTLTHPIGFRLSLVVPEDDAQRARAHVRDLMETMAFPEGWTTESIKYYELNDEGR
jgi:hypothetical protein